VRFYEQKLQATHQLLTEGLAEITPEQVAIALEKDRNWVPMMFPLPMHCIADGVPKQIFLEFKEFQELAPIVMKREMALLRELQKLQSH